MKIAPTKQELDHLHSANVQLSFICTIGKKMRDMFPERVFRLCQRLSGFRTHKDRRAHQRGDCG